MKTHRVDDPPRLSPRRPDRRAGPPTITRATFGLAAALAVLVPSALAQTVWVVAPTPGQGVNFTDIQPAVDAAQDGDVILVRPGTYSNFTVSAKSLTVAGDGAGFSWQGSTSVIENLAAGQCVVLRNVKSSYYSGGHLYIQSCVGPVTIEDVVLAGTNDAAVTISSCAAVALIDCELFGYGQHSKCLRCQPDPTPGLVIDSSRVHVFSSDVYGGYGSVSSWSLATGAGAVVNSGMLSAVDTNFVGGAFLVSFFFTRNAEALHVAQGAVANLRAVSLTYSSGSVSSISGGGTLNVLPGPANPLTANSPVRAGRTLDVSARARVGSPAALLLSLTQNPIFLTSCGGAVIPDLTTAVALPLGAVPASGRVSISIPVPAQLSVQAIPLFVQAVFADPTIGCAVSDPSAVLIVDSSF